jgi:RHS repeat-associated protein
MSLRSLYRILIAFACLGLARNAFAQAGNDNPGGVTAEYTGSVNTAGHYDPYTGNAKREIDDIVVAGSIGAYPLKFTRALDTRGAGAPNQFGEGGGWSHSYTWRLVIHQPNQNDGEDGWYSGPAGALVYPEGATVDLWNPDDPEELLPDVNGKHGVADKLVNNGSGHYELRRSDGGKVLFEPGSTATAYRAYAIIDPYLQTTSLAYDGLGRLWRVTEPGGRYLEFFYQNFGYWTQTNPQMWTSEDVIAMVRSNDGRGNVIESVSYEYEAVWITYAAMSSRMYNLKTVYYDDGSQASYTYEAANTDYQAYGTTYSTAQLVHSCDDPRYAGPMKQIQYQYVQRNEAAPGVVGRGHIRAEKNLYGQIVSQTTCPSSLTDPAFRQRTETRGDGQSRVFNYPAAPNSPEYSFTWTDFKNHTFTDAIVASPPGWRMTDPHANATSYEVESALGALKKVTHPGDGSTKEYTFTDPSRPYYHSAEKDENGNWTYLDRDGNNRVWQMRYPDESTEQFTYNGFGQALTHKLRSGGIETCTYDARGLKQTSYPPATENDPDPWNHPTSYFYYQSGANTDRLYHVNDPYGNATWFEYNQRGQITKVTHQDGTYTQSAFNPDGTLAWTADENHPGAATDANQRTRYTYDEYKRVLTVTNPMNETVTNYYGLDWTNPLFHTTNSVKYTLSPTNKNVVYDYDENFRRIDQVVALGTADEAWTLFQYDEVGNLTRTTDPRFKETTFGYDARNRKIWMNDPIATDRNANGHTLEWQYDAAGNKTRETRADDTFQTWNYDSVNRLVDHYGFGGERVVHYARNAEDTWEWITDAKNATYAINYDALHRKVFEHYPPDATRADPGEHFWYDAVGNLVQYKNPADQLKHFSYDSRNRQRDSWWDSGGSWIHTDFDAASRMTSVQTNGGETTVSRDYDAANRNTSETQAFSGFLPHHLTMTYDGDGNRTGLVIDSWYQLKYDYMGRNQLAHISQSDNTVWFAYTYDPAGNLIKRQDPFYGVNDSVNAPSGYYDGLNRPTMWENTQAGDAAYARSWYQYDNVGREVATWRDEDSGKGERFGYNARGQLVSAFYNCDESWGNAHNATTVNLYDMGPLNRNSVYLNGTVTGYQSNALNQYVGVGASPVGYDLNFNLYTRDGWRYDYSADNQLLLAVKGGASGAFVYDGLGRCVKRTINGVTNYCVFDGWKPTVEMDGGVQNLTAYNVYGPGADEILWRYQVSFGHIRYHTDKQGNVASLLDLNGSVLEKYTYDAFGKPTSITDAWGNPHVDAGNQPQSWYGNRLMFQGREWLGELGIYDYRHRMYQPDLGRFLQVDPTGFDAGDMNLFRYCGDDPVDGSDPTGLYAEGSGWTKENWEKYQAAQDKAANATGGAADRIESALKNGGKELSAFNKDFEKVYGPGSATETNLRQVDKTLRGMETALRDDGTLGYYANAATMKETLSNGLSKDTAAWTRPSDRHSMYVNLDHENFGKSALAGSLVHESSHNLGLIDVKYRGVTANRHGNLTDQAYFKQLPFREPNKALQNAETLTSFVVP